jgi:hypothetical protein
LRRRREEEKHIEKSIHYQMLSLHAQSHLRHSPQDETNHFGSSQASMISSLYKIKSSNELQVTGSQGKINK